MNRSIRSRSTVAIVSVLTLFACTGSGDGDTASPSSESLEPQTISVMVSGDPEELEAYRQVAEAYEASQDTVSVDLIEIAERDELIARLSTSIAGGKPPDLFLLNYRYYGQFQAKGALASLDPYLASSSAFAADEFYPEAMEAFQDDGQQTCMPQNVSSLVVYYNEDLFAKAGLDVPKPGWQWIAMVHDALRLTKDTDGDGSIDQYGLGVDPEIIRIAPFIWSNGAELVDDQAHPTTFTIEDPKAVQAIQGFLSLRSTVGVTPTDEEAESEDFETRFLNGSLGMIMESRRVVPTFRTIEDFEWDVVALPEYRSPSSILHSDAYCMPAQAEHQDAAWNYLEFALGPQGQQVAAETGRTVPSLISVANSDAFLDPTQSPANSQVFLDNIPVVRSVPHISTWPEIEDITNGLIEEAYYEPGGGEAAELAAAIVAQTEPLFARAEEG